MVVPELLCHLQRCHASLMEQPGNNASTAALVSYRGYVAEGSVRACRDLLVGGQADAAVFQHGRRDEAGPEYSETRLKVGFAARSAGERRMDITEPRVRSASRSGRSAILGLCSMHGGPSSRPRKRTAGRS